MAEDKRCSGLRLLLVEDSPTDAKLFEREVRRSHPDVEVTRVETAAALRAALADGIWDAVISDWALPVFGAMEALGIVQQSGLDLPFIISSGTIGEESAVEAMRAGAHDYVLKDKLTRLVPAIEREMRECKRRASHRAQEARYRALIEKSSEAILISEVDGKIVYASPAAEPMFGRTDLAIRGGTVLDLVHPDERERMTLAMASVRKAEQKNMLLEFRIVRPDGSVRWIESTSSNFLADPTIGGILTNLRDVTDHKSDTRALRKTEELLRQAQKMEAVGRLAGGIAHDFNNVLSVILSYGEFIAAEVEVGSSMHDDVQEIRKAAKRAADLTRHLLMFSRQQVLEPRVLDLNEVLRTMEKMLQRLVGEDVDVKFSGQEGLKKIKADPSSLEQVIMNLVINARDAMPTGGELVIETALVDLEPDPTKNETRARAHVMLAVTDSGIGMDAATQSRIFEPFFTTKANDKGTGLGLSTVFGIVEQSGGRVRVESALGKGTTFRIYLPCDEGVMATAPPAKRVASARGTETILLVEDEEQVRDVARGILKREGYAVIDARSASEAIQLCEKHAGVIDLMLSDVVMPQTSGPELAKQFSAVRPKMKILFMSGYTDDSIVRHGVLSSDIAFLQKPFTPASLATKIRAVLDS